MTTLQALPMGQTRILRLCEDPETHSLVRSQNGTAPLVSLSWRPGALTTALQASLVRTLQAYDAVDQGDIEAAKDVDPRIAEEVILAVVTEWDIERAPGEPLPLTAEGLDELGLDVGASILAAILAEVTPGKVKESHSSATSEPEEPSTRESLAEPPAGT